MGGGHRRTVEGREGAGGLRGTLDAVAAEAVRGDGDGQVETVGVRAERGLPGGRSTVPSARGFENQRVVRGPVRVVGARVCQQYGHLGCGRQRSYQRAGVVGQTGHDDRPAAEACFSQQLGDAVRRVRTLQRVEAGGAQGGGEGGQAVPSRGSRR